MSNILLCCDLDRTVLPNGYAHESPGVRDILARLVSEAGLTLAYVSGRNLQQLQEAIDEYNIPVPDYAIGDVGTTLYDVVNDRWQADADWSNDIGKDWQNHDATTLQSYLEDMDELDLQEANRQNTHKLSYYVTLEIQEKSVVSRIQHRLNEHQIAANIIYSVDEIEETGLIDILPARASKYHAIDFLGRRLELGKENILFAGDSGNDLPVLTSDIPSVLVNNAQPHLKKTARRLADSSGRAQQLYLARGGFHGLNGNYCAGILEGLAHFHQHLRPLISELTNSSD